MLEHHGAIITLVESGQHYGSALALLRPHIETSYRAFWTLYCVEEQHLVRIANGEQQFPPFKKCQAIVEKHFAKEGYPGLFSTSPAFVGQLDGLTHTGLEALQFRFDKDQRHTSEYPDEPICMLLMNATVYLTMTAIAHVQMVQETGNGVSQITTLITNKFLELFGSAI